MEAIYVLILFALLWLASLVVEQLRRRLRINYEQEQTAQPPPPITREILRPLSPSSEERARESSRPAPRLAAPEQGPRAPLQAALSNRRNLRRAIVLMTILGPCRANAPHE